MTTSEPQESLGTCFSLRDCLCGGRAKNLGRMKSVPKSRGKVGLAQPRTLQKIDGLQPATMANPPSGRYPVRAQSDAVLCFRLARGGGAGVEISDKHMATPC